MFGFQGFAVQGFSQATPSLDIQATTNVLTGAVGSLMRGAVESVAAAEGMDEIVTKPTLILAGEEGAEYVNFEPTMNEGEGRGGASIVFTGNVLSRDFIEDEALPMIKSALRKGGDIGIS